MVLRAKDIQIFRIDNCIKRFQEQAVVRPRQLFKVMLQGVAVQRADF
jgi:hypothetical protein